MTDVSKGSLAWHFVVVCRECLSMFDASDASMSQPSRNLAVMKVPNVCPRCGGKGLGHDEKEVDEWQ